MKRIGFYVLRIYLGFFVWLVLKRCRPLIIGIAGTTNKTFTKQAIEKAFKSLNIPVTSTIHNFNTDIGLPLTILDLPSGYNSYMRWLAIIPKVVIKALTRSLPKVLILELGISHPGDARHLTSMIHLDILIVCDITQRYRENFGDLKNLSKEYCNLVQKVSRKGFVILNYDTIIVKDLAHYCEAEVLFFSLQNQGKSEDTIYFVNDIKSVPEGIKTQLVSPQKTEKFFIPRFGKHHIYSLLITEIVKETIGKLIKS